MCSAPNIFIMTKQFYLILQAFFNFIDLIHFCCRFFSDMMSFNLYR